MLSVLCWRWGGVFGPEYVNRLRLGLQRHLSIPHRLVCVTDDPTGIDGDVDIRPLTEYTDTPRCRRRMKQYDAEFARTIGDRILSIDLDVVITGNLTPLIDRPEPIVCWKVGYADVFSGSCVLYQCDACDGAYRAFAKDPIGYPRRVQRRGVPSDQAMLNHWLQGQPAIPYWTEADGIRTYFGKGYEKFAHLGVGPSQPQLPTGTRLVVLGSADKAVMDNGAYPWIREHWSALDEVHA